MQRCYDIFEVLPDDALVWKAAIEGREAAVLKLRELARSSPNEFRLLCLPTKAVIFSINRPLAHANGR